MATPLAVPNGYQPLLSPKETERAIRSIKEFFQTNLAFELNLIRVTAPLFVASGTGVNDDLNGVEKPVSFPVRSMDGMRAEIVQSLAKWKRTALADLDFAPGEGLYTDMNAIRPDETLDATHSLYVDQWDWERVMTPAQRQVEFLKETGFSTPFRSSLIPVPLATKSGAVTRIRFSSKARFVWKNSLIERIAFSVSLGERSGRYPVGTAGGLLIRSATWGSKEERRARRRSEDYSVTRQPLTMPRPPRRGGFACCRLR